MRKILLLCILLPLLGIGQTKNVINAFRISPKPEKNAEFEKAFAAHAQKYHTGNWKWRVYEIQTGPDAGGFHIIEGPLSWGEFDSRGDLGAEHHELGAARALVARAKAPRCLRVRLCRPACCDVGLCCAKATPRC